MIFVVVRSTSDDTSSPDPTFRCAMHTNGTGVYGVVQLGTCEGDGSSYGNVQQRMTIPVRHAKERLTKLLSTPGAEVYVDNRMDSVLVPPVNFAGARDATAILQSFRRNKSDRELELLKDLYEKTASGLTKTEANFRSSAASNGVMTYAQDLKRSREITVRHRGMQFDGLCSDVIHSEGHTEEWKTHIDNAYRAMDMASACLSKVGTSHDEVEELFRSTMRTYGLMTKGKLIGHTGYESVEPVFGAATVQPYDAMLLTARFAPMGDTKQICTLRYPCFVTPGDATFGSSSADAGVSEDSALGKLLDSFDMDSASEITNRPEILNYFSIRGFDPMLKDNIYWLTE